MKLLELKTNPSNPRLIRDDKFKKLVQSISDFPKMMALRPIIIDNDNMILGGNMRFKALQELKFKEIPDEWVKRADELTEDEKRRFIISDNVSFGENDWDLIANEWTDFPLEEWGLDLPDDFGEQPEATEDDYEIPDEINTDIILGDLFKIGRHILLCGDSTKQEDVEKLMNGEKADMVFTDPPYGVNYSAKNKYLNSIFRGNRIQVDIENDTMDLKETSSFILLSFKQIKNILKERSSYYITAPQGCDLMMMMMMMNEAGIPLRHTLIWAKNNHVFGRCDYMYKHEPILFGWVKVHDFYGKGEHKFSLWNINKPHKNDLHPTMKPIELISNCLLNSSLENQLMVDLFLGSGSSMVAAHQLKRKCYGMEIDPHYCQVIIDRMRKLDPDILIKKNGIKI